MQSSFRRIARIIVAIIMGAACESAHAQFSTILNIPPDPNIGDFAAIGSNTQLNLNDGGTIGLGFGAGSFQGTSHNVEVNINGGVVRGFGAWAGSVINVAGGVIGNFEANSGSRSSISGGEFQGSFRTFNSMVDISGGAFGPNFSANQGSVLNISGGTFSPQFRGNNSGATLVTASDVVVNISGGAIGNGISAHAGSLFRISGGVQGIMQLSQGSDLLVVGGEFLLNGVAPTTSVLQMNATDVLTATLADGSPFALTLRDFKQGRVTLVDATPPPVDSTSYVVDADFPLTGLRQGQSLTMREGGQLRDNFTVVGARLDVQGGNLGAGVELINSTASIVDGVIESDLFAHSSELEIEGGRFSEGVFVDKNSVVAVAGGNFGRSLNIFGGSKATVTGGDFEAGLHVGGGSQASVVAGKFGPRSSITGNSVVTIVDGTLGFELKVQSGGQLTMLGGELGDLPSVSSGGRISIAGGSVGAQFWALSGGAAQISGGRFGSGLIAFSGSQVDISGGAFARGLEARSGSQVALVGGNFLINGLAPATPMVTLAEGDILTGELRDGSPIVLSPQAFDSLTNVTLVDTSVPDYSRAPITVDGAVDLMGLRAGQSLTLIQGGELPAAFTTLNAEIRIEDGRVGDDLELAGTRAMIHGGRIGHFGRAMSGSDVTISGGIIGHYFDANSGSRVAIAGGRIGVGFGANKGSSVRITGGEFEHSVEIASDDVDVVGGKFLGALRVLPGGQLRIAGGEFREPLAANAGSLVTLVGTDFSLNGVLLDLHAAGGTMKILDRNVALAGVFADGSPFSFQLNALSFNSGAMLRITLVPEPASALLLASALAACCRRRSARYAQSPGLMRDPAASSSSLEKWRIPRPSL